MAPPPLAHSPSVLLSTFLETTKTHLIPLTRTGVHGGSKAFGAAIYRTADLSLVLCATNAEAECPLWHAEVNAVRQFYEMDRGERGVKAGECVMLSTHEPCSLCLSALAWAGFPHVYYLFTYEDTRDAFGNPHDLDILNEVFRVRRPGDTATGELYNRENKFFRAVSVGELAGALEGVGEREKVGKEVQEVKKEYEGFAEVYGRARGEKEIPLA